jgi:hypothetical protein
MSVIDNWVDGKSKAIPTEYNGQRYKSKFEAKVAQFLRERCCNGEIDYEPKNFMLEGGVSYCPDFYIPSWRIWIEAKGNIDVSSALKIDLFSDHVRATGEEYLVLTPDWCYLYATPNDEIFCWLRNSNSYFIRCNWLRCIGVKDKALDIYEQ